MRLLPAALFALFLNFSVPSAYAAAYDIKSYEAVMTLEKNSPDIDVQLKIVYNVFSGSKSDGFKFVGEFQPERVGAWDENGPIRVDVTREKENKIAWFFSPVTSGEKTVTIRFLLRDALSGSKQLNVLEFPWLGVFRVPVHNAVYSVIFPENFKPEIRKVSGGYVQSRDEKGRVVIFTSQAPLNRKDFVLDFSPGLVEISEFQRRLTAAAEDFTPLMIFGLMIAIAIIGFINQRKRSLASGGTCGFSKSCSTGGSCGGGCGGGGCGGGGCGG